MSTSDLLSIFETANSRGAGAVEVSVSYAEIYNTTSGRTYLTLPRAATATKYYVFIWFHLWT